MVLRQINKRFGKHSNTEDHIRERGRLKKAVYVEGDGKREEIAKM